MKPNSAFPNNYLKTSLYLKKVHESEMMFITSACHFKLFSFSTCWYIMRVWNVYFSEVAGSGLEDYGSIPGMDTRFSYLSRPDLLWNLVRHNSSGYCLFFLWINRPKREVDPSPPPSDPEMSRPQSVPIFLYGGVAGQGEIYLTFMSHFNIYFNIWKRTRF